MKDYRDLTGRLEALAASGRCCGGRAGGPEGGESTPLAGETRGQTATTSPSGPRVYRLDGLHCGACRLAIGEFVGHVPGVAEVDVDLRAGTVTVHGDRLDDRAIREAITDAGYRVRA